MRLQQDVALPPLGGRVSRATMLAGGERVTIDESQGGVTITIPADPVRAIDRVVVLEIAR